MIVRVKSGLSNIKILHGLVNEFCYIEIESTYLFNHNQYQISCKTSYMFEISKTNNKNLVRQLAYNIQYQLCMNII